MIEFIPWSKKVLYENINEQKKGSMPVLDLELSAQCSAACCIYCDSKPLVGCAHAGEVSWENLYKLLMESKELGLRWIYTCGLGEPLEDSKFWMLLDFIKKYNINLSIFTNGLFIKDVETAKRLLESNVHIILKLDTFEETAFDRILGKKGTAKKVYAANEYLLKAGYGSKDGKYTNLAYSIVPTVFSIKGIPDVIEFAKKNGVFPSIGELENAGNIFRKGIKEMLDVSTKELVQLKALADNYSGNEYKRPICSAIMTGVHIDNLGNCVVDRLSGLNCKWFMLTEPDVYYIGKIQDISIKELFKKVKLYRKIQFDNHYEEFLQYANEKVIFGGCGGNISEVFKLALDLEK